MPSRPTRTRAVLLALTLLTAAGPAVPAAASAAALSPAGTSTATPAATAPGVTASLAPVASPASGADGLARNVATIRSATPAQVFAGGPYVQPDSVAAQEATKLAGTGSAEDAAAARTIARYPVAIWLAASYDEAVLTKVVQRALDGAEAQGRTPVFVTYRIPGRDCGGHSGGGSTDDAAYRAWNQRLADRLAGHRAVVVVEPDALAHLSNCPALAAGREATLAAAVDQFALAGVPAYLDAGHSNWVRPDVMAQRLVAAGVGHARGFSTNVSNYRTTTAERAYGDAVSAATGGARYVVDTSRNGRGWQGSWCNPAGAGLGAAPAVTDGRTAFDAQLWIKTPGASDGPCNGGPAAGRWFASYAVALVRLQA